MALESPPGGEYNAVIGNPNVTFKRDAGTYSWQTFLTRDDTVHGHGHTGR
jgi:hypothetical protein